MKWLKDTLLKETVGPLARRVGGNVAAFATALGLAGQHERAVEAAVAWLIMLGVEVALSGTTRNALILKAKQEWGKN